MNWLNRFVCDDEEAARRKKSVSKTDAEEAAAAKLAANAAAAFEFDDLESNYRLKLFKSYFLNN